MHIPSNTDSSKVQVKETPPFFLCVLIGIFFCVLILQLYLSNNFGAYTFFDELSLLLLLLVFVSFPHRVRVNFYGLMVVLFLLFYFFLSAFVASEYKTQSIIWVAYEYAYPLIALYYFYLLGKMYDFKNFLASSVNRFFWFFLTTMVLSALFPSLNLLTVATSNDGPDSLRVSWFFGNPNTLGYVLLSTLLFYWTSGSGHNKNRLTTIKVVVTISFIIITSSRSSLLILLILLAVRQVVFGKWSDVLKGGGMASVFLIGFLLFINTDLGSLFLYDRFTTSKLFFDSARSGIWIEFIENFYSAPVLVQLFGYGPSAVTRGDGLLFDNMYLLLLLELGLLGLGIIGIVVLYVTLPIFLTLFKKQDPLRRDAFVVFSLLLILCLSGFTSEAIRVFPYNFLFFSIFGLLLGRFRLMIKKG